MICDSAIRVITMTSLRFNFQQRAACLALLQMLFALSLATSFLLKNPLSTQKFTTHKSSTWLLKGKFYGRDDFYGVGELNKARTDIRNFLTQRALQSFIFLLSHCRDTATVRWLEVSPFRLFCLFEIIQEAVQLHAGTFQNCALLSNLSYCITLLFTD